MAITDSVSMTCHTIDYATGSEKSRHPTWSNQAMTGGGVPVLTTSPTGRYR